MRCHPLTALVVDRLGPDEIRGGGATGRVGHFGSTRRNPDGTPKLHKGIDLLCQEHDSVYAAHHGRVRKCGWESPIDHAQGYGQRVYLEGTDFETRYAHLSEIAVMPGDIVKAGKLIGMAGRTGNVGARTPTHLHFEVWHDGGPLDPALWLIEEEGIA